ncbi:unnamed protein product, partial [Polarella glacialis]
SERAIPTPSVLERPFLPLRRETPLDASFEESAEESSELRYGASSAAQLETEALVSGMAPSAVQETSRGEAGFASLPFVSYTGPSDPVAQMPQPSGRTLPKSQRWQPAAARDTPLRSSSSILPIGPGGG